MIIQSNIVALNNMMQLTRTNQNMKKSVERLSSGYRINRAADDAAGLAVSEKKRSQIRGLIRAAKNSEDGVGFVQTADGAMSETANILHRMRKLTIQSLNDVNTDQDRAYMQMEFDELQSEIDRIGRQTEFNKKNVFEEYADTYYNFKGNKYWGQDQIHVINSTNQTLQIKYQITETEPEKTLTLTVPPEKYTTQELIDEIDDIVASLGDASDGLCLEYTDDGFCNVVLQDGEKINEISGGLSYLFHDEFTGSQVGALIGTTIFHPSYPLTINLNNNELKFTIENFDGSTQEVNLTIPPGDYSRQEMIDYLNTKLVGTGMTASEYGDYSIQVSGDDGIITGLKGNMFKIDVADEGEEVMTSVFYDNTKYGRVKNTAAQFTGGAVLTNDATDTVNNKFHIDSTNNVLRMRVNDNGNGGYVEIQLDEKDYSISDMISELQNKFDAAGLDVAVGSHVESMRTVNGNLVSFSGLTLTSKVEGMTSTIEFDVTSSTAYDTLFVKRTYTDKGKKDSTSNGYYSYTAAKLKGGKTFSTTDFPLTLTTDNNSFRLTVKEIDPGNSGAGDSGNYTITLAAKTYQSIDEIVAEINIQIANGGVGISGKIEAKNDGGAITIIPASTNKTVTGITIADTTSAGYKALFVGTKINYSYKEVSSSSVTPTITLDKMDEPIILDDANNNLTIKINGGSRKVTVPAGTYTRDELAKKITEQLKGTTTTFTNHYTASGAGSTTNRNKQCSDTGKNKTIATIDCKVKGTGTPPQGSTAPSKATAASYTVPVALVDSTLVTSANNQITITVNDHAYTIVLSEKSYSPAALAKEINDKLNSAIQTSADKVNVTLSSDRKLVFATECKGEKYHISFGSATSSFFDALSKEKTPAQINTGLSLQNTITVADGSNVFRGNVDGNAYSVTLDSGTYTRSGLVEELNKKLAAAGIGVKASLNGNQLVLTTTEAKGQDSSIGFDTNQGGSSMSALFGDLVTKTPAVAKLTTPLQNNISLKDGENVFTVRATDGGSLKELTVTIPAGDYTRSELVTKLNELYAGTVTVSLNDKNSLTFTTAAKGSDAKIYVDNSFGGSAGKAMFGESTVATPDIRASFDGDGHLVLTGSNTGSSYTLSAVPTDGSAFLKPKASTSTINPTTTSGNVDVGNYYLQTGGILPSQTTIDSENKDFHFTFNTPSGTRTVDIVMDEKTYTRQELRDALQKKIDAALGADQITVKLSNSKIRLEATDYGSGYSLTGLSGDFYEYVLKGTAIRGSVENTKYAAGGHSVSDTYIIGRKDVNNTISKIQKGINDELSLDVTIDGVVTTLRTTLDPGEYNAQDLIKELQKKIDEQVAASGIPANSILVDIGKFRTNVYGADDANALDFYLNHDVDLKGGEYRIDGLKGSALFEIFYKTEGDLIPAYTAGTKDLTDGVEIEDGANTITVDVDGVTYSYTIPPKEYTSEELIEKLNELFDASDDNGKQAKLDASLSGNALKISYEKLGKHTVTNVQGTAKSTLFYEEEGRKDYESDLYLQIGANAHQGMELERFAMTTLAMGINSVAISKWKNANKALGRLDEALNYLISKRSIYGADQNRLEYTIKGNENTAENLQASESRDRDADMAEEMMLYSKDKILQQSQTAMLAQSSRQSEAVLSLLRNV